MSTSFNSKSISHLVDGIELSSLYCPCQSIDYRLTGPWVSEAARADLYGCGTHCCIIEHVVCRLDASQSNDGNLHRLTNLPHQAQRNRFDRRPGQSPCRVA